MIGSSTPVVSRPDTSPLAPFSNTLVLLASTSTKASASTIPRKPNGDNFVFRARGRDLKGGISISPSCRKSILREQIFAVRHSRRAAQGSIAEGAQLQGASLNDAQLQGASL